MKDRLRMPGKSGNRPPKKISPAVDDRPVVVPTPRRLALDVLGRVFGDQRTFDEAFAGHSKLELLEPRDRAFARLLVTTVLRRRGQIDEAVDRYMKKAPDPKVRNILRLGAAQLMFLETPVHAAVGETVELAGGRAKYAQGLVNAVLRRLANELVGIEKRQDAPCLNLPDWLWQSWTKTYGEETTRAIVEAQMSEPPLDISVSDVPDLLGEEARRPRVRPPDHPDPGRGRADQRTAWIRPGGLVGARPCGDLAGEVARAARRAPCRRSLRRTRRQDGTASRGRRQGNLDRGVRETSRAV